MPAVILLSDFLISFQNSKVPFYPNNTPLAFCFSAGFWDQVQWVIVSAIWYWPIDDCLHIVLFSALEQTHYASVACDSKGYAKPCPKSYSSYVTRCSLFDVWQERGMFMLHEGRMIKQVAPGARLNMQWCNVRAVKLIITHKSYLQKN